MNIEGRIKKDIMYSKIFIAIGVLAAAAGLIFNFQKSILIGLAFGFLPTGIGLLLVYKYAQHKPKMIQNIKLENEERNLFINTKAGHTAFWVCYWYVFIVLMLSNMVEISLRSFGIITIFFMPIVYFLFVFIYHKKY